MDWRAFPLMLMIFSSCAFGKGDELRFDYLVRFEEMGIVEHFAQIKVAAKAGKKRTSALPDFSASEIKDYESDLAKTRAEHLSKIQVVLGRKPVVEHAYSVLQHAIAAELTLQEAANLEQLAFIGAVYRLAPFELHMHSTPGFVGADWIWDGLSTASGMGTQGQGIKIGVIDTGVTTTHPFFRPMGLECGYSTPMPKVIQKNCNRAGCPTTNDSPLDNCVTNPDGVVHDCVGHGTAVAGIVAGREMRNSSGIVYQGIAKCAQIVSYKAGVGDLVSGGFVDPAAAMAAMEQAVRDQVQVVNMSFGPNIAVDPWASASIDALTLGLLRAGILPVTSAGNDFGEPGRMIEARGEIRHVAPWEMVVGAATGSFPTYMGGPGSAMPDQLGYFSLRGPVRLYAGVTKPDLVAPGINIYSANTSTGFINESGTSLAAPVVAGGAALLKAANPDWSPAEIQSALMLTAKHTGEAADNPLARMRRWLPDEAGSGRIALLEGALAGFVLHESYEGFRRANPAMGGDPSALNLAQVRGSRCVPSCTWTRRLKATRGSASTWVTSIESPPGYRLTITPSTFVLNKSDDAAAEVVVTIRAESTRVPAPTTGEVQFGTIWFDPVTVPVYLPRAQLPSAHMTVGIQN